MKFIFKSIIWSEQKNRIKLQKNRRPLLGMVLSLIFFNVSYFADAYYDSVEGRFLSPDPEGLSASENLYDYSGGDPVNGIDPDGRFVRGGVEFANQYRVVERGVGALQAVGGAGMAMGGGALMETPLFPLGAILIGEGFDQFQAGVRTLATGEIVDSMLVQGLTAAGMSSRNAGIAEAGLNLAGGVYGSYRALRSLDDLFWYPERGLLEGMVPESSLGYLNQKGLILVLDHADEGIKYNADLLLENRPNLRSSNLFSGEMDVLRSDDEVLILSGHAYEGGFGSFRRPADALAEILYENMNLRGSNVGRIYLFGCHIGRGNYPQALANHTGLEVYAPTQRISVGNGYIGARGIPMSRENVNERFIESTQQDPYTIFLPEW